MHNPFLAIRHHAHLQNYRQVAMLFCLSIACGWSQSASATEKSFRAAFVQAEITPPVGFRKAGGYSEVISTGIHDPLFCKTLLLEQNNIRFLLIMNDLLSVPYEMSQPVRTQLAREFGVPLANIVIAGTHNHGSPEYWGSLRDLFHEIAVQQHGNDIRETVDYQKLLREAWRHSTEEAFQKLQPLNLQLLMGYLPDLAFNRRFHMRDGSVRFNPGQQNPEIIRPAGPIDSDFPVLLFSSSENPQQKMGALSTFAIHTAVHSGTDFSADFPSILQSRLQEKFGSNFISIFAEGAAGDLNHIDVTSSKRRSGRKEVERIGNRLADTFFAQQLHVRPLTEIDLAVRSKIVQAPFEKVSRARYEAAKNLLLYQQTNQAPFLTLVAAWRDCHRFRHEQTHGQTKPLEVQVLRLNSETAIVTLPHEILVDIGLAIKAASPFKQTIVISLANDVDYYIPTRKAFAEGSYEVTTCPLDPGCGELLIDTARELLLELYSVPN